MHLAEALTLAQQHGYRIHYALARRLSAWAHQAEGRLKDAQQDYEEALAVYRDVGLLRQETTILNELAETYDLLGMSRQSLFLLQQAAAILAQLDDPHAIAVNQYNQAYAWLYLDDREAGRAAQLAQEALVTFRARNQTGWVAATLMLIGFACWVDGRYGEALAALQEA
jgi:tetratricopeptide (TPR) repeat protein